MIKIFRSRYIPEVYGLHDLDNVFLAGSVWYVPCATSHNGNITKAVVWNRLILMADAVDSLGDTVLTQESRSRRETTSSRGCRSASKSTSCGTLLDLMAALLNRTQASETRTDAALWLMKWIVSASRCWSRVSQIISRDNWCDGCVQTLRERDPAPTP